MKISLVRSTTFSCAHLYEVKAWTKDQNLKEFGPCFSPEGHGHTYRLEAYVSGPIDPKTGMILNLRDLDSVLKAATSLLDNKHLNFEVEAFKNLQPTTENIAKYLWDQLEPLLVDLDTQLDLIRLYETEDLWVECIKE